MRIFSHRKRPTWFGPYPLEKLPRTDSLLELPGSPNQALEYPHVDSCLATAMRPFASLFDSLRDGSKSDECAPIPDDPEIRSRSLKGGCYFLGADQAGTCRIPERAFLDVPISYFDPAEAKREDAADVTIASFQKAVAQLQTGATSALSGDIKTAGHEHALVIVTGYVREADAADPGADWITGTQAQCAALRSMEIACVLASYVRKLGYSARAHGATASDVDCQFLLLASGLGEVAEDEGTTAIVNPFLGERLGCAVVTTNLALGEDGPLAARNKLQDLYARGPTWWLGLHGVRPGWRRLTGEDRPLHMGRYPMERIKRVARPTTLIDGESIPRIPKRHDMFVRAGFGDLGEVPQREVGRFVSKEAFATSMQPYLIGMVPLQCGAVAEGPARGTDDANHNTEAVRALCYYMGADMVGVTRAEEYVWYSHKADGTAIDPYHKNAIVVLLDQGFETMEGASGDDWISASQSMRGYMHGSLICGVVAEHIRNLGWSARVHSVVEQDVLHIPLILNAGLGELSRIGELVLNPYVGPRFKSAIITTDMPLKADRPIDFGLQDFCSQCQKCARECPCQAIPYGAKIMFNGYEIWKPDVQKCAKYRITNPGGAACGRCMKTCPFNMEGTFIERLFLWSAIHLPFTRKFIAGLDDFIGKGRINPVKKWWFNLEEVDGKLVKPKKVNTRQLNLTRKGDASSQDIAVFPVQLVPSPDAKQPIPVNRGEGREARRQCEALWQARAGLVNSE
jgi:reductive dehalogenase